MKKIFFLISLFLFFPVNVFAFSDTGASTIVMDIDSGRILYEKDVHKRRLIASITKIMTCIIVLENCDIEKEVVASDEVLSMYGTNIYLEVGEKMKIKDLLYGMMLRSGNDASMVLAVNTFGNIDEFISKMNDKAKEIGMFDTEFNNPHGLDEDTKNYSSAYDMALLSRYAYKNEQYKKIISTKKYTAKSSKKSYTWYNRMGLINTYKNCIGGKNGYTPKASKTLVSLAKKDNLVLTVVSLKDGDIYSNHKDLYEEYFSKYKRYLIVDKNNFYIDKYFVDDNNYYLKDSFYYPLKESELDDVSTLMEILNAKSDIVGRIIIKLKNKEIGKINIYRKQKEKKENLTFFQKIKNLIIR